MASAYSRSLLSRSLARFRSIPIRTRARARSAAECGWGADIDITVLPGQRSRTRLDHAWDPGLASSVHRPVRASERLAPPPAVRRQPAGRNVARADRRAVIGGWTTLTGQGAWCRTAWLTEPSIIPRTPPRPREPTTSIWASCAAASSAARGVPSANRRWTATPGCSFSQRPIACLKSSSSRCAPPRLPALSASAHTARRAAPRSAASSAANVTAACETAPPRIP
jgi:hypothetical protein